MAKRKYEGYWRDWKQRIWRIVWIASRQKYRMEVPNLNGEGKFDGTFDDYYEPAWKLRRQVAAYRLRWLGENQRVEFVMGRVNE